MPLDPAKLRPSERRVYDLRMENMRIRDIAEKLGFARSTVDSMVGALRKRGAVFPPAPPPSKRPLSQLAKDIIRLRHKQLSNRQIAAELGKNGCQVSYAVQEIRRHGIRLPRAVTDKHCGTGYTPATIRLIGTTPQGFTHRVLAWDEDEGREAWKALGGRIERVERIGP